MNQADKETLHRVLASTIADLVTATMGAIKTPEDAPEVMGIIHCALSGNLSALAQFSSAPEEEFVAFCASTIRAFVRRGNAAKKGNAAKENPSDAAERMLNDILSKRKE